jgi:hypothetical protein
VSGLWSRRSRVVVALGAAVVMLGACGSAADESANTNVRAVLSAEDAGDILPGSTGDFVVMVHLNADGTTIPLVMLTPRTASTYASYLITDDSVYLMEVPAGAAWPLTDTELSWDEAIISSESQLQPEVLARTAEQLPVAVTVTNAEVDSSIIAWTQQDVAHMAGAYVIADGECIPAVVRQTAGDEWLLTAVPGWNDGSQLAQLVRGAASVVISDSTQVNPSRISACQPGG